jgi:hypothetical protein
MPKSRMVRGAIFAEILKIKSVPQGSGSRRGYSYREASIGFTGVGARRGPRREPLEQEGEAWSKKSASLLAKFLAFSFEGIPSCKTSAFLLERGCSCW